MSKNSQEEAELRFMKRYPQLDNIITFLLQGGTRPPQRLPWRNVDGDEKNNGQ